MPTTITMRDLADLNACPEQRALFAKAFPDGVTVTPDNYRAVAKAAAEAGLDVSWYANRVLVGGEREAYDASITRAWAAYDVATAAAWAAYATAVAEALCSILARRSSPCS